MCVLWRLFKVFWIVPFNMAFFYLIYRTVDVPLSFDGMALVSIALLLVGIGIIEGWMLHHGVSFLLAKTEMNQAPD